MASTRIQFFPERTSTIPMASTITIISAQTAATGTNYTAFGSNVCDSMDIVNNSGYAIEYRRGAAGLTIPIPTGSSRLIVGIANSNEIDIRRVDTSNTQITITAEAITL